MNNSPALVDIDGSETNKELVKKNSEQNFDLENNIDAKNAFSNNIKLSINNNNNSLKKYNNL
jgi:hypothetical protein